MTYRRSTLALAVLSLLAEAQHQQQLGMHPYKMQRLMKDRGKGEVVNVGQRASLYRTIERLHRKELIEVRESSREHNRPERTLYALTDEGTRVWREWMLDALATPKREFPEFLAAMAFVPLLEPGEVADQLARRQEKLETELTRLNAQIAASGEWGRLFTLELECLRATTEAELEWVESVIKDLRSGSITWSKEWLAAMAAAHSH
ncbi:PadR family transcriptional regulator [Streptomyces mashuensis]|uniref:PadR family transcriptional regulator n=1 Tax=Streptomyces mashuensis TaxID=33904 RepID=A0A919EG71_9ACTN|nr:helix-turn-helix transcriptional regulator [Streptomyces mashuensis]GHF69327.1 PadR family transcriptional regulator [Streptomyces mashuensis]